MVQQHQHGPPPGQGGLPPAQGGEMPPPQPYQPGMTIDSMPPVLSTNPNTPLLFQNLAEAYEKYEQARQMLWQVAQQRNSLINERRLIVEELKDYQRRNVPWSRIDISDDGIDEIPAMPASEVALPPAEVPLSPLSKPSGNGKAKGSVPKKAPASKEGAEEKVAPV